MDFLNNNVQDKFKIVSDNVLLYSKYSNSW